jgi:hypothetical protein
MFRKIIFAIILLKTNIALAKPKLVDEIKKQFCKCDKPDLRNQIDFELFHQPYLKDSIFLFIDDQIRLNEIFARSQVKIVYRITF